MGVDSKFFADDLRIAVSEHEAVHVSTFGKHPSWNTLDLVQANRFKDLGIDLKLSKSAQKSVFRQIPDKPEGYLSTQTRSGWVLGIVSITDQAKEELKIATGLDPAVWEHPLVTEAIARAVDPAQAFTAHALRGVSMFELGRHRDAVYDLQYVEAILNNSKLQPEKVEEAAQKGSRFPFRIPFGDRFSWFGRNSKAIHSQLQTQIGGVLAAYAHSLMELGREDQAKPRWEKAFAYDPGLFDRLQAAAVPVPA